MLKSKRKLSESDDSEIKLDHSELSGDEIGPISNKLSSKRLTKKFRHVESEASDSENVCSPQKGSPKKKNTLSQNDYSSEDDFSPSSKSHGSTQKDIHKTDKTSNSSDSSIDESTVAPNKTALKKTKTSERPIYTSESEGNDVSSDEEEPISKRAEVSKKKGKQEKTFIPSDSSDSEDFTAQSKTTSRKRKAFKKAIYSSESEENGASTDEELLNKVVKETKVKPKPKKVSIESSSSEDETLEDVISKPSSKQNGDTKVKGSLSVSKPNGCKASSDDEPLSQISDVSNTSKIKKISLPSSSSDDEQFTDKSKNFKSEHKENSHDISDEESLANITAYLSGSSDKPKKDSVLSDNSRDEHLTGKSKKSSVKHSKVTKQKRKSKSDASHVSSDDEDKLNSKLRRTNNKSKKSDDRIENLKKYIRIAGIRINSYDKLFEKCKSVNSKAQKLHGVLVDHGLKGRPSIEKCKRLRKKIETKNEIAELDKSNIISSGGRSKRTKNAPLRTSSIENSPKNFSHLRDIIESEDSD